LPVVVAPFPWGLGGRRHSCRIMSRIELVTHIAAPPDRCFDLSRSLELHMHSTATTGERAVGGVTSGLLGLGEHVIWRARHFLVWQELTSRITGYDRPRWFRDEQAQGIFQRLEHDHFFETTPGGGTIMRDVFDYRAPLGVLGSIAERVVLDRYLRGFLVARNAEIKAAAESEDWNRYLGSP
jgi:ligand-binding SRPBCC domain-containing protein